MNYEFLILNFRSFFNFLFEKAFGFLPGRKPDKNFKNSEFKIENSKFALSEDGFTLIELLVVLVILALLAGLVGPTLVEKLKPAKRTVAAAQIEEFSSAIDSFYMDTGRYPSQEEGFQVLRDRPPALAKWNGPYLKKEVPLDPWSNPYVYRCPGQHGPYDVLSFGADGKEGGEGENADVTSWESNKK